MASKFFSRLVLVVSSFVIAAGALAGCRMETEWGANGASLSVGGNPDTTTPTMEVGGRAQDELSELERQLSLTNSAVAAAATAEEQRIWVERRESVLTRIRQVEAAQAPPPAAPAAPATTAPTTDAVVSHETSDQWFHWSGWGSEKSPFWMGALLGFLLLAVFFLRDAEEEWAAVTPVVVALIGSVIVTLTPGGAGYTGRLICAGVFLGLAWWCLYRPAYGHRWRIPLGVASLIIFYGLI